MQTTTDPTSRTVSYQYDGQGYLQEVDGFDPSLRSTFTYDSFGRLASTTSYPDGYTLQIGYDTVGGNPLATLNRPVSATFPDGSYTEADYTRLDAEWLRDREGNWTHRLTNKLRQNAFFSRPRQNIVGRFPAILHHGVKQGVLRLLLIKSVIANKQVGCRK